MLAWLAVMAVSVAWMIARLVRTHTTAWEWTVWLSATVLLGPLALLVHRLDQIGASRPSRSMQVLCASLFCVTGYALAWILAVVLLLNMGDDPNGPAILGATVLIPVTVGLLLIRTPLLRRGAGTDYRSSVSRGIPGEIIAWSLGFAVFFPLTLYVDNRWLSVVPSPTSPFFWPMISLMALAGLLVFLPLHYAMSRRGFYIWPRPTPETGTRSSARLPTLRNSWAMLLLNLAIMITVLGLSVSTYT